MLSFWPITLSDEETLILAKRDRNRFYDMLDENIYFCNSLKAPCGYFKNNLCEIHDIKPMVCKTYPLVFGYRNFLTVCLCPMGEEIGKEFKRFSEKINATYDKKDIEKKSEVCRKNVVGEKKVNEFLFENLGIPQGKLIKELNILYSAIPQFLKYLRQNRMREKNH